MLTKPTNWDTYLANPLHYFETIIKTANAVYTQDSIMSLSISQNLFGDEYSVGGVVMNQLDATIHGITADAIPKFTRVEVWTRICVGSNKTAYIPKGVFYTKKPSYDTESQTVTITGYDEMFRTEQVPFETGSTLTAFSSPTFRQMAKHIVEGTDYSGTLVSNWDGCGLVLESESQVSTSFTFPSIPYGYTVREILSDIATACGGNWTVCFVDTGTQTSESTLSQTAKLRLIGVNDLPTETHVLVTEIGSRITFGGVGILV